MGTVYVWYEYIHNEIKEPSEFDENFLYIGQQSRRLSSAKFPRLVIAAASLDMRHMVYNCTRYCPHDVHANIRAKRKHMHVYAAVRWPLMDVKAKSIRVYHTARISHCTRLHRIPKRCLRVRGEYRATFITAFKRANGTLQLALVLI